MEDPLPIDNFRWACTECGRDITAIVRAAGEASNRWRVASRKPVKRFHGEEL